MKISKIVTAIAAVFSMYSGAAIAEGNDSYQKGLIATVYMEGRQIGKRANKTPKGTPIGSFIDAKIPTFSFENLKQEESAWSLRKGSLFGVEWNGFLDIKEDGAHVFVIDFNKKAGERLYANNCIIDFSISGKSVVNYSFTLKGTDYRFDEDEYSDSAANSLELQTGYYPVNIWLHCGITDNNYDGEWESWVNVAYSNNIRWNLKVKRPSDRVISADNASEILVWK